MGLLFPMPVAQDERDRVQTLEEGGIIVKSYGLPLIFWGYLMGILILLFFLFIAGKDSLAKMLSMEDSINIFIAYSVYALFLILPFCLLCFYFYEKTFVKKKQCLEVIHKIFWIPIIRKTHILSSSVVSPFLIEHYLDSGNMARMKNNLDLRAFYNQGYYILLVLDINGVKIPIDRHSSKASLKNLAILLGKY